MIRRDAYAVATWCSAAAAEGGTQGRKRGPKRRLDDVCRELRPDQSRNVIQSWIMQGKVTVDGRVIHKAGHPTPHGAAVEVRAERPRYVCRAGYKLEAALEAFDVVTTTHDGEGSSRSDRGDAADVAECSSSARGVGKVALDSGLSTGGFTDCLLQNGIARVYGVDVGYGQVADKIRRDSRVVVMERTNLRHLRARDIPERVQIVTLDLSFISLLKVMDAVCDILEPGGDLVALIKPQFEARREEVARGGLVRSDAARARIVEAVSSGIAERGFALRGVIESPIRGAQSGNKEFLAHFKRLDGELS